MKKKLDIQTVLLVLAIIFGVSLIAYPTVGNYINTKKQAKIIQEYNDSISGVDYTEQWEAAVNYNKSLLTRKNRFKLTDEQREEYPNLLNISGTGIMGYIEIPKLGISVPIYHGTDEAVLANAVGHIDWTSLPIGGESCHSVLSAHRGLAGSELFTDLDQLEIGDTFTITVLDKEINYVVDQILVVKPQEVTELQIIDGEDHCTLVTCTPYGVNSHRLLVRGTREVV